MVGSFRKQGDWGTHLEGTRRRTQAVTHAFDLRSEPSKPIGSVCCASARTASPSFTIRRTRSVRGSPGGSHLWSRYGGTNGRQTGRPRLDERPEWGAVRTGASTPRDTAQGGEAGSGGCSAGWIRQLDGGGFETPLGGCATTGQGRPGCRPSPMRENLAPALSSWRSQALKP